MEQIISQNTEILVKNTKNPFGIGICGGRGACPNRLFAQMGMVGRCTPYGRVCGAFRDVLGTAYAGAARSGGKRRANTERNTEQQPAQQYKLTPNFVRDELCK